MKKACLFLAALMASSVLFAGNKRVMAYNLAVSEAGDVFTFTFMANDAATAGAIEFYDETGAKVTENAISAIVVGENSVQINKADIAATGKLNWAVRLEGEAIEDLVEFTDASKDIYNFYLMQGVAVNNCPESDYFGNIYLTVIHGLSDGASARTINQPGGIYSFNIMLEALEAVDNNGFAQALLPTPNDGSERQDFKRISVDPMDGMIYFNSKSAIYKIDPADTAHYTNILEGKRAFAQVNCCYALNGNVYFMDNANTSDGGTLKMIDAEGNVTSILQSPLWGVQDMSITTDGRGGFWLAQHRWNADAYATLSHVNMKDTTIDFSITSGADEEITKMFPQDLNASYRGQCAYNVKEDLLAFGGNKAASLYHVEYDGDGVPTLELVTRTGVLGSNIDGLAFDWAGNLYVASASTERFYAYGTPTEEGVRENICSTPAKKEAAIEIAATGLKEIHQHANVSKMMVNGKLMIMKNGRAFNAIGASMK